MNTDRLNLALVLFACVMFLITVLVLPGCGKLRELDEAIWNPPTMTPEEIQAADPPPLLEAAAAIAAFLGYGGFAVWIKRIKSNGNAKAVDLQHQIAELRADIANHKENVHAPAARATRYDPGVGPVDTTPHLN